MSETMLKSLGERMRLFEGSRRPCMTHDRAVSATTDVEAVCFISAKNQVCFGLVFYEKENGAERWFDVVSVTNGAVDIVEAYRAFQLCSAVQSWRVDETRMLIANALDGDQEAIEKLQQQLGEFDAEDLLDGVPGNLLEMCKAVAALEGVFLDTDSLADEVIAGYVEYSAGFEALGVKHPRERRAQIEGHEECVGLLRPFVQLFFEERVKPEPDQEGAEEVMEYYEEKMIEYGLEAYRLGVDSTALQLAVGIYVFLTAEGDTGYNIVKGNENPFGYSARFAGESVGLSVEQITGLRHELRDLVEDWNDREIVR